MIHHTDRLEWRKTSIGWPLNRKWNGLRHEFHLEIVRLSLSMVLLVTQSLMCKRKPKGKQRAPNLVQLLLFLDSEWREIEKLCFSVNLCESSFDVYSPSFIHLVNVPETNMQIAIPMQEHITSGRRLKRFKNQAFSNDITKRVTPTKIDTRNASMLAPISCN